MTTMNPSADTEPSPAIRVTEATVTSAASQHAALTVLQSLAWPELLAETSPEVSPELPAVRRRYQLSPAVLCLLGVLVLQAALSLRLIWSNTAFEDEALYLWAGHLEWLHWLHGTPVPDYASFFSGA